ncbi:hypothetical protein ANN_00795 [Periplaneta americana]|uniref:C-type lectin domain-containing protein n=1 Tax=Periplaneta americana TaxID=6978 RepID=A0ABQ8TRR9_PERAM|nr:hypothetical protein ANN_00795 [Periplaneta americana]
MSPGSSTESYPAFVHIRLREYPRKKPQPGNVIHRDGSQGDVSAALRHDVHRGHNTQEVRHPSTLRPEVVRHQPSQSDGSLDRTAPPRKPSPNYELIPGLGYYKLHTEAKPWHDARQICAQEGAHLAIINSEEEAEELKAILARHPKILSDWRNEYAYIGMSDIRSEGDWITIFGTWLKEIWSHDAHYVSCHRLRLQWCRERQTWTAADWKRAVFRDASRFSLSSDDGRGRVWRPCGARLNPTFAVARHTAPIAGVLIWGAIIFDSRSLLESITAQRYVQDILLPHVLTLMPWLPREIFSVDVEKVIDGIDLKTTRHIKKKEERKVKEQRRLEVSVNNFDEVSPEYPISIASENSSELEDGEGNKSRMKPTIRIKKNQMILHLPNMARECDRRGLSDREAASIASAPLQDIGVLYDSETSQPLNTTGYMKWAPNQPDQGREGNCGLMQRTGGLHDVPCALAFPTFSKSMKGWERNVGEASNLKGQRFYKAARPSERDRSASSKQTSVIVTLDKLEPNIEHEMHDTNVQSVDAG